MQNLKRMIASFGVLMALCIVAQTSAAPATADFFVSLQGRDQWSGHLAAPTGNDGPFATVARARDAVRALLKTRKEARSVRVVLRGGTYYLEQPLKFGVLLG